MRRKGNGTFLLPPISNPFRASQRNQHLNQPNSRKQELKQLPIKSNNPLEGPQRNHRTDQRNFNSRKQEVKKSERHHHLNQPNSRKQDLRQSIHGALQRISHKVNGGGQLPEPSDTLNYVTKTLGLSQNHVIRLYRNFKRIDDSGSGFIDREEFFAALEEEETHVTKELFKLIDINSTGSISFDDFVRVCSTWCLFTKKDMLKFCFDCFDADASGFIDENEFKVLCSAVNKGSPMFPGNFDAALHMLDDNGDGVIDFREFKILDKRFPLMLFPIFRLQEKMQRITLGEKRWIEVNQRIEMGRSRRLYMDTHDGDEPRPRKTLLPRMMKLPPLAPDPDRIDAMKRGKAL